MAQQHLKGNLKLREAWPKAEANFTELFKRTKPASEEEAGLLAPEDKAKLDGIEEGAQVNQNAYAKVNGMEADNPSDEVTIEGGTGITVTQNPNEKKVTITATGESTPGPHGTSHMEHGADPIPNATISEGGLMSAEDKQKLDELDSNFAAHLADYATFKGDTNSSISSLAGSVLSLEEDVSNLSGNLDDLHQNKVTKGLANLNDFDEPTRLAIQGMSPGNINAVLGYRNVRTENTNFIRVGKNKVNPEECIFDVGINNTTGEIQPGSTVATNKIYLEGATHVVLSYITRAGVHQKVGSNFYFYDINDNYLGRVNQSSDPNVYVTVPAGSHYCRAVLGSSFNSVGAMRRVMVEFAAEFSEFESYRTYFSGITQIEEILSRLPKTTGGNFLHRLFDGCQIKFLGDSITQGVGGTGFTNDAAGGDFILSIPDLSYPDWYVNTNGHCFANSIRDYIQQKFPNCTVKNWGTRSLSARYFVEYNVLDTLVENDDDIVIIMLGTNDRNQNSSLDSFITDMGTLVDYCTGKGKQVILISPPPCKPANDELETKKFKMEDVHNATSYVGYKKGVPVIPLFNLFQDYLLYTEKPIGDVIGDDIHPNDAGHDVIFDILLKQLGLGKKVDGATW